MIRIIIPSVLLWLLGALLSIAMHQGYAAILADAALVLLLYPPLMIFIKAVDKESISFIRNVAGSLRWAGIPIEYILRYAEIFIR